MNTPTTTEERGIVAPRIRRQGMLCTGHRSAVGRAARQRGSEGRAEENEAG